MRAPRFFVAWDEHAEPAKAAAARFSAAVRHAQPDLRLMRETPSLKVLADPRMHITIEGNGTFLHICGEVRPAAGVAELRRRLEHSPCTAMDGARLLAEIVWGDYVALVDDGSECVVLRDPSGAAALFVARSDFLTVASSELTPKLLDAGGFNRSVNLPCLAHVLARPPSAAHLSLLSAVTLVAPGGVTSLRHDRALPPAWSPALIAEAPHTVSPDEVLQTLDDVTTSLSQGRRVGVELSGGFDSSSVFASLAAAHQDVLPFNVATAGHGGDERHFARSMAARWQIPLVEYEAGSALPEYWPLLAAKHEVTPFLYGLDSVFAGSRGAFVQAHGIEAVMTGQGGDALFFQLPTRLVAADRLQALGPCGLPGRQILDDAVRVKGSVWSVLATALGMRHEDDRTELPALTPHLLGASAHQALQVPALGHPWLQDAIKLPPAKVRHLMMLVHSQLFQGARLFSPAVPVYHPLLAQPLVELMLACPAYVLAQGQLDRGFARKVMSNRLSTLVVERRSKGEASDHYARAVLANRGWLRGILLEGALAHADLIDPAAIERALQPESLHLGTDYRAFALYASLEAWLRHWA